MHARIKKFFLIGILVAGFGHAPALRPMDTSKLAIFGSGTIGVMALIHWLIQPYQPSQATIELLQAISDGNYNDCKKKLDQKADVNEQIRQSDIPQCGIYINALDKSEIITPLRLACHRVNEIFENLKNKNLTQSIERKPLEQNKQEHFKIVVLLRENGATIDKELFERSHQEVQAALLNNGSKT